MDKLRLFIAFDGKAEPYFVHCTHDLVEIGGKVPAIDAQKELSDLYAELTATQERVARLEEALKAYVTAHDVDVKELGEDAGMESPPEECDCDLCEAARRELEEK